MQAGKIYVSELSTTKHTFRKYHFCRVFKREMKVTAIEYINNYRLSSRSSQPNSKPEVFQMDKSNVFASDKASTPHIPKSDRFAINKSYKEHQKQVVSANRGSHLVRFVEQVLINNPITTASARWLWYRDRKPAFAAIMAFYVQQLYVPP